MTLRSAPALCQCLLQLPRFLNRSEGVRRLSEKEPAQ